MNTENTVHQATLTPITTLAITTMVMDQENSQAHSENFIMALPSHIAFNIKKSTRNLLLITTRIVTTPTQTTYLP